jgi:hypothetical protein
LIGALYYLVAKVVKKWHKKTVVKPFVFGYFRKYSAGMSATSRIFAKTYIKVCENGD